MKICSTFENKKFEKRIAITPEIAKKYINLGLEVSLIENYGLHLGYDDSQYKELGVNIIKDEKELINNSDIIVQLALLSDDKISLIKEKKDENLKEELFNSYEYDKELIREFKKHKKEDVISKLVNNPPKSTHSFLLHGYQYNKSFLNSKKEWSNFLQKNYSEIKKFYLKVLKVLF